MNPTAFVQAGRNLLGAKWKHRGRKLSAVDCIGLLALAMVNSGATFRDENGYGREPWDDRLRKGLTERFGSALLPDEMRVGDIVLIRWGKGEPSHVGIVANHPDSGLSLIHAHNVHGVVEQKIDARMRKAIIEVYRPWSS